MTKLPLAAKKPPASPPSQTPSETLSGHYDSGDGQTFLARLLRTAGIYRKEFQYSMRVSKTTVDKWYSGELPDPFERAKLVLAIVQKRNPTLVGAALLYIAGDSYDGLILDAAKKQKMNDFVEAIKK